MAAYEVPGLTLTYPASADISTSKFRCVKLNSSGQAAPFAAATDNPLGILQDAPAAAGRASQVMHDGVSLLEAGSGGVTAGDVVMPDASGKGVTCTVGTDTTKYAFGKALSSAASGALFACLFDCKNVGRAS